MTLSYATDGVSQTEVGRQVNIWYDDNGAVYARAFSSGTSHRIEWPGVGMFVFEPGSTDVRVSAAPHATRQVVEDTFARLLQPIILQALGWQALHASAVVGGSGIWAFCARSGSGKSTLAFALQRAGFRQFADDALVVSVEKQCVLAHALPFIPRLESPTRDYFDVAVSTRVPSQVGPASVPLDAVFLLQRNAHASEPTEVTQVAPAHAFSSLLAHAHCFDADDAHQVKRLVADYLAISETVPVFMCSYRPGLRFLPELIESIEHAGRHET